MGRQARVFLWLVVGLAGCRRPSESIDFTRLDFSQLGDGGVALPDFSTESQGSDLAGGPGSDLAGAGDLASTDFAGGVGCEKFADRTLSWHVQDGVSLTTSGPLAVTVPDGVLLTGKVSLPSAPPGGTYAFGRVAIVRNATQMSTQTRLVQKGVDGRSFTYSLTVPPGTYDVGAQLSFDLPSNVRVGRYLRTSTTVCGATAHDVALPALPTLTSKPVTVTGLGALGPTNNPASPRAVWGYFESEDHTLLIQGYATPSADNTSATLSLPLPAQTLLPSLLPYDESSPNPTPSPAPSAWSSYLHLPSAPAAASYSLAMPEVAQLKGAVTLGALSVDPALAECLDATDARWVKEDAFADVLESNPSYKAYYRKGGACLMRVYYGIKLTNGATSESNNNTADLVYQPSTTPVSVNGDVTTDFVMPTVPASVAMAGSLRDARGNPLRMHKVRAISTALDGLDGKYFLVADVVSDTNGNFTLNVLPGTYTLVVTSYRE